MANKCEGGACLSLGLQTRGAVTSTRSENPSHWQEGEGQRGREGG